MPPGAQGGECCPPADGPETRKPQSVRQTHIETYGLTQAGRQRYRCIAWGRTFTATTGTRCSRRRTSAADILETLALIAEGRRVSSIARVKGHQEATILHWLRAAAQHGDMLATALLANHQRTRGQLDAMWSSIKRTREKKGLPPPTGATSGARRCSRWTPVCAPRGALPQPQLQPIGRYSRGANPVGLQTPLRRRSPRGGAVGMRRWSRGMAQSRPLADAGAHRLGRGRRRVGTICKWSNNARCTVGVWAPVYGYWRASHLPSWQCLAGAPRMVNART
jgi:transposase-like protein